jgi:hypothetical protein
MNRIALGSFVMLFALIGAGCAGAPASSNATAAPSPSNSSPPASSSPSPPSPLGHFAVVTRHDSDGMLYFIRDDGVVLGQHASNIDYVAPTTAAGRFWYIARADGHLHSVTPAGTDRDVAALPDVTGQPSAGASGLAVSPDGSQWAWGVTLGGATGPSQTRVDVGGIGIPTRHALAEATTNAVLSPIAWTSLGVLVARDATGIGGCCYLTPEYGATDAVLLDTTTLEATSIWTGCSTAAASNNGSFACAGATVVVHPSTGAEVRVHALSPVSRVGWTVVDDSRNRVLFGVIHTQGQAGRPGPYVIDTEAADLSSGVVAKVFDQATPDAVLPDGSVVVTSAPTAFDYQRLAITVRLASGNVEQLGPTGSTFVGLVYLPN